jgi:hypothetical protein
MLGSGGPARTAVKAERSEFIVSLDGGRSRPYRKSGRRRETQPVPTAYAALTQLSDAGAR